MSATYYILNLTLCLSPYLLLGITQIFWNCRKGYSLMQGKIWVNICLQQKHQQQKKSGGFGWQWFFISVGRAVHVVRLKNMGRDFQNNESFSLAEMFHFGISQSYFFTLVSNKQLQILFSRCSISVHIHYPPQQAGCTHSLNCSAAQHKGHNAASPRFLAFSHRTPRAQHIRVTDRPAQRLPHQILLPFLPQCATTSGAPVGWPKAVKCVMLLWNKSEPHISYCHMQKALLQPLCHGSKFLSIRSQWWLRHLILPIWEQREWSDWGWTSCPEHCRMGVWTHTDRDGTGALTELKQERNDLSTEVTTV